MQQRKQNDPWQQTTLHNFWKEIAPYDHVVQLYEHEDTLIEMLVGFILDGLHKKEGIIAIMTDSHRSAVDSRLQKIVGTDMTALNPHYNIVDANRLLTSIRRNGVLQRRLFIESITQLVSAARKLNRKVRVYSEMVTIVWEEGNSAETHRLEEWWNQYCEREVLGVWHAYPRNSFVEGSERALERICCSHAKIIAGVQPAEHSLQYRRLK